MRPDRNSRNRQSGLGLATALFVITILALIAVYMSRLVTSNVASFTEEMELVQSFYAAESGAQFAMNNIFFPLAMSSTQCPALTNFSFTAGALNTCSAAVACEEVGVDVDGDGNNEAFYTITSEGSCGLVTRTIQVRAVSGI